MKAKKIKLLLVDDDDLGRRMMAVLLSGSGYDHELAANGKDAVEAVKTGAFDFVLMDIQMPYLDGYEATRQIRSWEAENDRKRTTIFALTAMLFAEETQKCIDAGMDGCIMKPFNSTELFGLIDAHVQQVETSTMQKKEVTDRALEEGNLLDIHSALPRFGNDINVYQEFLDEFFEQAHERLSIMRESFGAGNYKSLRDAAHNLKGVAASLGAMRLSVLARDLEQHSYKKDASMIEEMVLEIEKMFASLQSNAQDLLLQFED